MAISEKPTNTQIAESTVIVDRKETATAIIFVTSTIALIALGLVAILFEPAMPIALVLMGVVVILTSSILLGLHCRIVSTGIRDISPLSEQVYIAPPMSRYKTVVQPVHTPVIYRQPVYQQSEYGSRKFGESQPSTPLSQSGYGSGKSGRSQPSTPLSQSGYGSGKSGRSQPSTPLSQSGYGSGKFGESQPSNPLSQSGYGSRNSQAVPLVPPIPPIQTNWGSRSSQPPQPAARPTQRPPQSGYGSNK